MERLTFEGNFCDIAMCTGQYRMTSECADGPCSQRKVWERLKMYEDREAQQILYQDREKVYKKALATFGDFIQMVVAIEEMAEFIQAVCKILRGGEDFDHLAEETADATIMLDQMRLLFNNDTKVCEYVESKVRRLEERLGGAK